MKKRILSLVMSLVMAACMLCALPAQASGLPYTLELRNGAKFTKLDLSSIGNDPEKPVTTADTTDWGTVSESATSEVMVDWTTITPSPITNFVLCISKPAVDEILWSTSFGISDKFEGDEFNVGQFGSGSSWCQFVFYDNNLITLHTMTLTTKYDSKLPQFDSISLNGSSILADGQATPAEALNHPILVNGNCSVSVSASDPEFDAMTPGSGLKATYSIYSADGTTWNNWTETTADPLPFGYYRFMAVDNAGNQALSGYYYFNAAATPTPAPTATTSGDTTPAPTATTSGDTTPVPTKVPTSVPATGDNGNTTLWLAMLTVCVIVLTISLSRKAKKD